MNKLSGHEFGLSYDSLCYAAKEYGRVLDLFITQEHLPRSWFASPDHLAIKCANGEHYGQVVNAIQQHTDQIHEVSMNDRRLASALLTQPLVLGDFGPISWLEIMQPRPEKEGVDVVGIDHAEFYFPDFAVVTKELLGKGIGYAEQQNPSHEWLSIQIGSEETPLELKLNNGTLADVVAHELAEGKGRIIWPQQQEAA